MTQASYFPERYTIVPSTRELAAVGDAPVTFITRAKRAPALQRAYAGIAVFAAASFLGAIGVSTFFLVQAYIDSNALALGTLVGMLALLLGAAFASATVLYTARSALQSAAPTLIGTRDHLITINGDDVKRHPWSLMTDADHFALAGYDPEVRFTMRNGMEMPFEAIPNAPAVAAAARSCVQAARA